ncbi:MAG: hypothetical protein NPIRA01_39330 [Nitrospirales bacterium]|nr:MAG: hypothetical protein NPIRA01_39330 [Nitrospirales bacterium]
MQEVAKIIKDGGQIVNISTDGSKAALEQFTKGLAHELAPKGVTINTVSPGFIETAMMPDSMREIGAQMSPLKRIGTPKDIADVVAFVVSEDAR